MPILHKSSVESATAKGERRERKEWIDWLIDSTWVEGWLIDVWIQDLLLCSWALPCQPHNLFDICLVPYAAGCPLYRRPYHNARYLGHQPWAWNTLTNSSFIQQANSDNVSKRSRPFIVLCGLAPWVVTFHSLSAHIKYPFVYQVPIRKLGEYKRRKQLHVRLPSWESVAGKGRLIYVYIHQAQDEEVVEVVMKVRVRRGTSGKEMVTKVCETSLADAGWRPQRTRQSQRHTRRMCVVCTH